MQGCSGVFSEWLGGAQLIHLLHQGEEVHLRNFFLLGKAQKILQRGGDELRAGAEVGVEQGGFHACNLRGGTTECNGFEVHGAASIARQPGFTSGVICATSNKLRYVCYS